MSTLRTHTHRAAWLAGAVLGLVLAATTHAETLEEVTVLATSAAARTQQENLESEMAAYVRSVEAAIEASQERRLKEMRSPARRLALASYLHRG